MPREISARTPVVKDMAQMLERRCRRTAGVTEVEPEEVKVEEEWAKVVKQLGRTEVAENIVKLTKERLTREPGTIRPRKNGAA